MKAATQQPRRKWGKRDVYKRQLPDVIFGSIATLIGAVLTYLLRKKSPWLAPVPPIVANTLIIPPVLK